MENSLDLDKLSLRKLKSARKKLQKCGKNPILHESLREIDVAIKKKQHGYFIRQASLFERAFKNIQEKILGKKY